MKITKAVFIIKMSDNQKYALNYQIFFQKNNLDRYLDRPNAAFKNGRYRVLNNMCYAEFLAYYVLETKSSNEENDFQPKVLCDDDLTSDCVYPRIIPLMTS